MKLYKYLTTCLIFAATAMLFIACNKDDNGTNGPGEDLNGDNAAGYVYMDMTMQLPTAVGSRSTTDWTAEDGDNPGPGNSNSDEDPDTEEGLDYENTVKTVLLVLSSSDGKFISASQVVGSITKLTNVGEYSIKAKFKRDEIDAAYAKNGALEGAKGKVKIYAYVNYTANLNKLFSQITDEEKAKAWLDYVGEIGERPSKAGSAPVISNTIWAKHSFLMTNATEFNAVIPEDPSDWDQYSDSSHPLELAAEEFGAIKVERAAARIDFKDASKNGNNTYELLGGLTATGGDENINLLNVQLTRMSLVNMGKKFYYLRRVASNYHDTPRIGKYETNNNYVVDADWDAKYNNTINPANASDYFNFPLYGTEPHGDGDRKHYPYNRSSWYTDNIADVLNGDKDNYGEKEYHIWRYVVENTLPEIESQKTVQSTGIIFKGLILPGKDIDAVVGDEEGSPRYISLAVKDALMASEYHLPKYGTEANQSDNPKWDLKTELTDESKNSLSYDYPALYEFEGLLYAGFDEVVLNAADEGQGSLLYAATQYILEHWTLDATTNKFVHNANVTEKDVKLSVRAYNEIKNGVDHVDDGSTDYSKGYSIEMSEDSEEFKLYATTFTDADASNFTIYESSFEDTDQEKGEGWGYYCYYFYWNRHNDNGLNGKMGPMEFAIVRNNVYKLSVKSIARLGHPRNPDNDPDPFTPDEPDEDPRVYLNVDLKVLPWVVRTNTIEF